MTTILGRKGTTRLTRAHGRLIFVPCRHDGENKRNIFIGTRTPRYKTHVPRQGLIYWVNIYQEVGSRGKSGRLTGSDRLCFLSCVFSQPGLQCADLVFDEMQRIAAQCEGTELSRFPCLRDRIVEVC